MGPAAAAAARLPLRRDRPGDRPAAGEPGRGPADSGARILVVEDNVEILELINLQLRDRYRIYVASDGQQGLELAQRERPDLIVTDYMMPEMDGLTMLRRMRADPQLAEIPVIMLSARSQIADRVAAREAGADVYLGKPFSPARARGGDPAAAGQAGAPHPGRHAGPRRGAGDGQRRAGPRDLQPAQLHQERQPGDRRERGQAAAGPARGSAARSGGGDRPGPPADRPHGGERRPGRGAHREGGGA